VGPPMGDVVDGEEMERRCRKGSIDV
jgi:hypothetical protein